LKNKQKTTDTYQLTANKQMPFELGSNTGAMPTNPSPYLFVSFLSILSHQLTF
jgi:hypothetical protein